MSEFSRYVMNEFRLLPKEIRDKVISRENEYQEIVAFYTKFSGEKFYKKEINFEKLNLILTQEMEKAGFIKK